MGESINVGEPVQVVGNSATSQFPLVTKGLYLKSPIDSTLDPLAENLIGVVDDRTLVVSGKTATVYKYENNVFSQVDTFTIETSGKVVRVVEFTKNKILIITQLDAEVSCILFHLDKANDIRTIHNEVLIVNEVQSGLDVVAISETKVAVGYIAMIRPDTGNPALRPMTTTFNVDGDGVKKSLRPPLQLFDKGITRESNRVGITKLAVDKYITTHCTIWNDETLTLVPINTDVIEIAENDTLTKHLGYRYRSYTDELNDERYVKPKYLGDNKILVASNIAKYDTNIEILEVNRDLIEEDEYTFDVISTVKSDKAIQSHNIDLLQSNDDGTNDYVVMNTELVSISKDFTRVTKKDSFNYFARLPNEYEKTDLVVRSVKMQDGLRLYLDEGKFQLYKHSEHDGNFVGIANGVSKKKCSVVMTGLVDNIPNVNLTSGENVFYNNLGILSHDILGEYIGQATSHNSFIIRPYAINIPTISRPFTKGVDVDMEGMVVQVDRATNKVSPLPVKTGSTVVGLYKDGKVHYNGLIPYLRDDIKDGRLYYYNDLGKLVLTPNDNGIVGIGVGKGIYITSKAERESIIEPPFIPVLPNNYTLTITGADSISNSRTSDYTCEVLNNGVAVTDVVLEWTITDVDGLPTTLASVDSVSGYVAMVKAITANKQGFIHLTVRIVDDVDNTSTTKEIRIKGLFET